MKASVVTSFDRPLAIRDIAIPIVGTRADLAEVFRLHAAGRTRVELQTRKLEDVNDAIEDVLAGRVTARVVFEL
jgi:alcohol dehydrogenase, propanol-preferring